MTATKQRAIGTLSIQSMTCGSCEQRVRRALEALAGVESAQANRTASRATVSYDPDTVTPAVMVEALRGVGYPASIVAAAAESHAHTADSLKPKPSCGCCQA